MPTIRESEYDIGQVSYTSGEMVVRYWYAEYEPRHPEYGAWAFWKQDDWVNSKRQQTNIKEIEDVGLGAEYDRLQNTWPRPHRVNLLSPRGTQNISNLLHSCD